MESGENSNVLINRVCSELLLDSPDIAKVNMQLQKELDLSSHDAQKFIYQVVKKLNNELFPPVTKLEIVHTEACNLACSYCFESKMYSHRIITAKIAQSAVDILFDYSQDQNNLQILHFGGEPLLNFSSIKNVTEYAEEKAALSGKTIDFNMTTNGTLITEKIADYLARHKIKVLLSVDGLEASHNRFRINKKGEGSFAKVKEIINLLKKTRFWIGVKMTVMPQNVFKLLEDVRGLYEMGVNQFIITSADGINWSRDDMEHYGKQYAEVYQWYKEKTREDLRISQFDELDNKTNYFGCQAGRNSIAVSVNGEISPCSKLLAKNNKQLIAKLGDVQYGLTHIKNRHELVISLKLKHACESKGIDKEYQGGCYASNYEENNNIFQPSILEHNFVRIMQTACETGYNFNSTQQ